MFPRAVFNLTKHLTCVAMLVFSLEADMDGNSAKIFKEGVRFCLHIICMCVYTHTHTHTYVCVYIRKYTPFRWTGSLAE